MGSSDIKSIKPLNILYIDNHLLVVNKPAGLLVQGDATKRTTLLDIGKDYLRREFNKPGNVYLGLVHRLDRLVSGTIIFARTSKAASRLSEQFRNGSVRKVYRAIIEGIIAKNGRFNDYIDRRGSKSFITNDSSGKYAELDYKRIKKVNNFSFVEINLLTGRHHQIRVQFSHRGYPILGDIRYEAKNRLSENALALHAYSITIFHPITKQELNFKADMPSSWNKLGIDL